MVKEEDSAFSADHDPELTEGASPVKMTINGYTWCNMPLAALTLTTGQRVRWHLGSVGTEDGLHNFHWHGNVVEVRAGFWGLGYVLGRLGTTLACPSCMHRGARYPGGGRRFELPISVAVPLSCAPLGGRSLCHAISVWKPTSISHMRPQLNDHRVAQFTAIPAAIYSVSMRLCINP